jgi:hypothetical protein
LIEYVEERGERREERGERREEAAIWAGVSPPHWHLGNLGWEGVSVFRNFPSSSSS